MSENNDKSQNSKNENEKKEVKDAKSASIKEDDKKQEKSKKIVDEKKKKRLELKPGMTIRVSQKIKEVNLKGEEKERIQYFEGMIIAKKHGNEAGATITIRKISNGIGVEKIFPINLPSITKIEVKKQAKVKRAKLGFLKRGYKKKLKEKKVDIIEVR